MTDPTPSVRPGRPNRWIGPLILLTVFAVVVVVFVVSNDAPTDLAFGGFRWTAVPLWSVIVIALVVGAVGSRVLAWAWRAWRRRRRRLADEVDTLRRRGAGPGT